MTEQKEQSKLKYMTATFVGDEFTSKGVYKKGPREGKEWQRYTLKFKEEEFNRTFGLFIPMLSEKTIQFADLKKGEDYNIGYREEPFDTDEGQRMSKTAVFFGEPKPKEEQPTEAVAEPKQEEQVEETEFNKQGIARVYKEYMDAADTPTPGGFIGYYVTTFNCLPELSEALLGVYEEESNKKKPEIKGTV